MEEAIRVVRSCADALHHAHENGVVYRNLKPSNILLSVGLEPKIVDFGISLLGSPSATQQHTPHRHISPEQIVGRPVDGRTDIFGLGVLLYQLVCGHYPFPAESAAEQYRQRPACAGPQVPQRYPARAGNFLQPLLGQADE